MLNWCPFFFLSVPLTGKAGHYAVEFLFSIYEYYNSIFKFVKIQSMPLKVFNVTKNRLIRYPSEWEDGDEVWYSTTDHTEPIWHNNKCGYWAHEPSFKINSPNGKYGEMTALHREGEMEMYCKWVEAKELLFLFPEYISCPYAKYCKKVSTSI